MKVGVASTLMLEPAASIGVIPYLVCLGHASSTETYMKSLYGELKETMRVLSSL